MARREARPARREEPRREGGKSGLLTGLMLGLAIGLAAAAGLAWYFNFHIGEFKSDDAIPPEPPAAPVRPLETTRPEETGAKPAAKEEKPPAPPPPPVEERKTPESAAPPPRVPLTFYGILPGDKPAKPVEPPKSKEIWWLQVAALKNPGDADKLKARLSLLGLDVATQKIEAAGQTLWRVRVGPYQRDEEAFADLDTLASHNYEPRLLKEPAAP